MTIISQIDPVSILIPTPALGATVEPTEHQRIDRLEQVMLNTGQLVDLPLIHRFTDGMYIRRIFMPAGTLATSKIHKTEHPYVILSGRVSVLIPGKGVEHLTAGHLGVTQPGTRRVLYMHEDTVWVTFHRNPTNTHDLDEIEQDLIEPNILDDGSTAFDQYLEMMKQLGVEKHEVLELESV